MSISFRVPMIFPGQGSQKVGMAQDLISSGGVAADYLSSVNEALGDDLTTTMFEGPGEKLTETHHAQPAILAHSVAVAMALRELGIEPSLVAGHSLGEFSAAVAAGAIDPADGLSLVRKRGDVMFAAGKKAPGTMAAVLGLGADEVREVCSEISKNNGVVVLANHNSDGQIVISGEIEAVAAATEPLKAAGAKKVIALNVSGAFHSPLLVEAAVQFGDYLAGVTVGDPSVPLVANVSAKSVTSADVLKTGFVKQLTSPVLWRDIMLEIAGGATPPKVVLEVGPGRVLTNLAKRAYPETTFLAVGTTTDLESIADRIAEAS